MSVLTMPFALGQEMWLPCGAPRQVQVPCPVCAGKLAVMLTLGDGEQVAAMCDGCGLGFDGPRGFIHEWEQEPKAEPFIIASVESMRGGDEWYLRSETGAQAYWKDLCATEAEALAKATERATANHEENMRRRQGTRKRAQHLTWSVRYHREQIADLQRQIRWHESKVAAKG